MKHWNIALDVATVYRTRVEANTEEEAKDLAEQEAYEDTWGTGHSLDFFVGVVVRFMTLNK